MESQSLTLQKQISRYAPIHLEPELTTLSEGDKEALGYILKASIVIDDIFYEQVWNSNRMLRDWLKTHSDYSSFDNLKWAYYSINKSPWSCLDENKAFLSTADSAVKLLTDATKPISGWKGVEYRAAFPQDKPGGANFYPPDMNKMATFEAFIGIRDDVATSQLKLFGGQLEDLEKNLPMDNIYKSDNVSAAPIRVMNLLYNSGDVKGPQTIAFNLPNDERIVNERGTSMVMLKNISEAKFKLIVKPIADACIREEQKDYVDFEPYYTHIVCHECCHGIGPHSIILPSGKKSTVRLELLEFHSALEEAKADIVGLWALNFLINKVEDAVESLSREILTIQAKGDKPAAQALLQSRATMTQPLRVALEKIEHVQVPVDIAPMFGMANKLLANI
ncbi:hypothetical protein ACQ4PT_047867 [Festuca glaucescens]